MPEVKTYIGCKIIQAFVDDERSFLRREKGDTSDRETRSGYTVIYPDGYVSWSPKEVFEAAYREISPAERALM